MAPEGCGFSIPADDAQRGGEERLAVEGEGRYPVVNRDSLCSCRKMTDEGDFFGFLFVYEKTGIIFVVN